MPNITLSVDAEVIRQVRRIALDRNTSLTAMVRAYLESIAQAGATEKEARLEELRHSFSRYTAEQGPRSWRREDLYDR